MKKLQEKRYKRGITLISLAITVVVLIILAGVSINAVVGDDGIIKKAQESANLTKESEAKEIINRAVLEFRLTEGYDTLEDFLRTKVSNGKIDSVINNGDGTLNVSKNGYTVTVENKTKKGNSSNGDNTIDDDVKPEPEPTLTIGTAKVVANSDGTGDALGEASTYLGNTLYIMFSHSIIGGTTTVSPSIPYAVTVNGTYKFIVTGIVNEKSYTKEVSVTVNQFKDTYEYMDKNTEVTYPDGKVWVPEEFKIADDSSDNIQGGVVIEDKDGNQFVWVPVDTINDYKRVAYSEQVATEETDTTTNSIKIYDYDDDKYYFTEALPEDEKNSVTTYKGFYIGRYEAGDKDSTEASTPALRTSRSSTSNKISVKANQAPYNWVTRPQAQSLAEGFKTQQNYSSTIKTKLVSSYAWDTTIAFMQKANSDYGNSSEEGNYYDTIFSYIDITGASQTKVKSSPKLVPTGQTTQVCNIYDMGGNAWEWTTESYSNTSKLYTLRGGCCGHGFDYMSAGSRCETLVSYYSDEYVGFRITLFM